MLGLLAPRAVRATGLDSNHAMLSVARANLERVGLSRVDLRQGDIHAPPFGRGSFDLVVVHQVLHYLDDLDSKMECMRLLVDKDRQIEGLFTGYSAAMQRSVLKKEKYLDETPPPAPVVVRAGRHGRAAPGDRRRAQPR